MELSTKDYKIDVPVSCPSCGSALELVNSQLFCRNSNSCPAQSTKRLQHFCKVLKIKGFGEKTVEKLEISHISELIILNTEYCESKGLGTKTAQNLVFQVQDRLNKKIYVSDFLAAMSIPLVGSSLSAKLAHVNLSDISYEQIKEVGGGDKAANNIMSWVETDWIPELEKDWNQYLVTDTTRTKIEGNATDFKGSVCITGKLNDFPNRKEAASYLATLGWEVKSTVTKKVQFLVCEDETKTNSSSYKKAESLGIEILTIKDLEDK